MQVKKFEAPTIAEALKLVKTELGPEAIILSTKNHRKGFGLLSKASVEVTAAVADKSLLKKQLTEKVVPSQTKDRIGKLPAAKQAEIFDQFTGYYTRRAEDRRERRGESPRQEAGTSPASGYDSSRQGAHERGESRNARPLSASGSNDGARPESQDRGESRHAPGKTSGPPRYVDIADEEQAPARKGYGRNGRILGPSSEAGAADGVHADAQSERIARSYNSASSRQNAQERGDGKYARSLSASDSNDAQERGDGKHARPLPESAYNDLQEDIQHLKNMLEEIKSEQVALADSKIPETSTEEIHVEYQNLLRNGIDKRYATALTKQVTFALSREALQSSDRIVEALAVEMMNNIKVDDPLDFKAGGERRVFALVGPTGVGKTTTIAKLASQAILQRNLRVGLINVDSYKVAALDQLATYAKILNVPFRQASSAAELDRALSEFKPLDLVLIDTSGRSQRDSESLTHMRALLSECAAVRPLLIMSTTTRDQELYDIITRFKIFNPTGLVFSKLDETSTFGCIYNVSVKTALPLTYFTVGQRVPEDLEPASKERMADLILDL